MGCGNYSGEMEAIGGFLVGERTGARDVHVGVNNIY